MTREEELEKVLEEAESCPYCGQENCMGVLEYPEDAEGVWHVWWGQGRGGEFCDKHLHMLAQTGAYIYSCCWERFED